MKWKLLLSAIVIVWALFVFPIFCICFNATGNLINNSVLNSSESHVLKTFVREFPKVFYYVLNPVNMPNISDKH